MRVVGRNEVGALEAPSRFYPPNDLLVESSPGFNEVRNVGVDHSGVHGSPFSTHLAIDIGNRPGRSLGFRGG